MKFKKINPKPKTDKEKRLKELKKKDKLTKSEIEELTLQMLRDFGYIE